jgi:Protein of unknown function (DUF1612)
LPAALWGALAEAEDALARLDERLSKSPIRDGFINRTHFGDACASLALDGKLVSLEDLVLHDARMDIRSPTHEVTLARAVLRARRRIAAAAPDWALSPQGLAAVRGGGGSRTDQEKEGTEEREDAGEREWLGAGALDGELAAVDRALARSSQVLAGGDLLAKPRHDPLLYDSDDGERLKAWLSAALASASDPPCLASALLWEAWEQNPPLERQAWLGNLLVAAHLRSRRKTRSHLFPFELGAAPHPAREAPLTRPRNTARRLP